jgi:hypothetical protein
MTSARIHGCAVRVVCVGANRVLVRTVCWCEPCVGANLGGLVKRDVFCVLRVDPDEVSRPFGRVLYKNNRIRPKAQKIG